MSQEVERMFTGIAPRYDRANRVLSLGVDQGWRRAAVRACAVRKGDRVLDLATGTADLALRFERAGARVTGADFSAGMLRVARGKLRRKGSRIALVRGDALALPFRDGAFDAAAIAFGIRNVDRPVAGLAEMARVVRAGGKVCVLEFGQPEGPLSWPYRAYSRFVLPTVGGLLTGDRAAYEYLPRTAARFPCGDGFVALMRAAAGFADVRVRKLTGGIAYLYVGTVA